MPSTTDAAAPLFDPDELHRRRKVAVAWLEWACGAPLSAVAEEHPRYRVVTANLDPGSRGIHPDPFSSCALLGHWMLLRVGVRLPWLDHPSAPSGWRSDGGVLSRLVAPPVGGNRCGSVWDGRSLEGGDIVIIANRWPSGRDAHVVCTIDQVDGALCTAEYGQPGGALRTHNGFDGKRIGKRLIRTVLPLEAVLADALQSGALVEPDEPEILEETVR